MYIVLSIKKLLIKLTLTNTSRIKSQFIENIIWQQIIRQNFIRHLTLEKSTISFTIFLPQTCHLFFTSGSPQSPMPFSFCKGSTYSY